MPYLLGPTQSFHQKVSNRIQIGNSPRERFPRFVYDRIKISIHNELRRETIRNVKFPQSALDFRFSRGYFDLNKKYYRYQYNNSNTNKNQNPWAIRCNKKWQLTQTKKYYQFLFDKSWQLCRCNMHYYQKSFSDCFFRSPEIRDLYQIMI